jgi:hypothetical protein
MFHRLHDVLWYGRNVVQTQGYLHYVVVNVELRGL